MQRISLGALIIALALLVDDAMTTTDAMLTRLAQGDDKVQAATFAFRTYAFAMLAGTLVDDCGLRAGRLCGQLRRRVHLLAVCGGGHCARRVLVRGGLVRAVAGRRLSGSTKSRQSEAPGRLLQSYRGFLTRAMRAR